MRVCLISREYPPDSGWGGIATYTYHHAHSLKDLGHDVEVVALADVDADNSRVGTHVEDEITVHRVAAGKVLNNLEMLRLATPFTHFVLRSIVALSRKILQLHQENPFDVAECPEHLAEGLCPALTRLLPLVVRLHTPQSKFIAERFHNLTPSFDQEFVAMIERVAMLSADVLTSPSQDMAEYVAGDMSYPLQQIKIIRNPIDVTRFNPEGNKALTDEKLKVLFVGRLEERKGIHYLIEAVPKIVSQVGNASFVIIGADTNNAPGQKSTRAELQKLVKQNNCAKNVTFIPYVPLAQMPDYYRSADICVVPSLYDNAPCTVLEGMSSGKPVVTTSAGGSKEYVVDGQTGYVVAPRDSMALAESITRLLQDKESRLQMGTNARQRVLDRFHPWQLAQETVETYRQAIKSYAQRKVVAPYPRPADRFMEDTENLLTAYNKMLYEFLYVNSFRFRIFHRFRRAANVIQDAMRRPQS